MEQRITENMGRSLKEHGYRDPVFVGKGKTYKSHTAKPADTHTRIRRSFIVRSADQPFFLPAHSFSARTHRRTVRTISGRV